MFIQLIAIVGLLQNPIAPVPIDRQKPITYETSAKHLDSVLEDLSKQAGVALESTAPLSGQILCVRLDRAPLGDVMDRLARAAGAEWQPLKAAYRLVRTERMEQDLTERALSGKVAAFQKALEKIRARAASLGPWDSEAAAALVTRGDALSKEGAQDRNQDYWQRQQKLVDEGPAGRAKLRVLSLFDPRELAGLPVFQSVMYSSAPNASQRALPNGADEVLAQFIREQAQLETRVPASDQANVPTQGAPSLFAVEGRTESAPFKMLVKAIGQPMGAGVEMQVRIFDAQGRILGDSSETLADNLSDKIDKKSAQTAGDGDIIQVSPLATALQERIINSLVKRDKTVNALALDPSLAAALTNPREVEPLGLLPGEELVSYARLKGLNIIASLDDGQFLDGMLPLFDGKKWNPKVYLEVCSNQAGIDLEQDDKWVVIRPSNPMEAAQTQEDRASIGALIADNESQGHVGIDEVAAFLSKNASKFPSSIGFLLLSVVSADPNMTASDLGDWELLRFYGSLSAGQRASLVSERGLHLSDLSPSQLAGLGRIVLGPFVHVDMAPARPGTSINELRQEVTEVLPNGFTGDLVVSATETKGPTYFVTHSYQGNITAMGSLDEDALATQIALDTTDRMKIASIQLGYSRKIRFRIQLAPDSDIDGLELRESAPQGQVYRSVADLPEAVRQGLEAKIAAFRQRYEGVHGSESGGTPPPPSRRP